jgi:colicin import membrane protein
MAEQHRRNRSGTTRVRGAARRAGTSPRQRGHGRSGGHAQLSAAQARAEKRIAERAAERGAAQEEMEQLRDQLERVRADAAPRSSRRRKKPAPHRREPSSGSPSGRPNARPPSTSWWSCAASWNGQASGEIAAAQQGAQAEVARARADAEEAIERAHAEVEQIRAQASAQVAAAGEQADAEIAAARQAADTEIARLRAEAHGARPADPAHTSVPGLLTIPIPPVGLRAHTGPIEEALAAEDVASQTPWRMTIPVPAGLQNSHQNGGPIFLIFVADFTTAR